MAIRNGILVTRGEVDGVNAIPIDGVGPFARGAEWACRRLAPRRVRCGAILAARVDAYS
jgi:hypothetical protein